MIGRLTRIILARLTGYQPMTEAMYQEILQAIAEDGARLYP